MSAFDLKNRLPNCIEDAMSLPALLLLRLRSLVCPEFPSLARTLEISPTDECMVTLKETGEADRETFSLDLRVSLSELVEAPPMKIVGTLTSLEFPTGS